jgi:hypothetical protein
VERTFLAVRRPCRALLRRARNPEGRRFLHQLARHTSPHVRWQFIEQHTDGAVDRRPHECTRIDERGRSSVNVVDRSEKDSEGDRENQSGFGVVCVQFCAEISETF